MPEQNLPDVDLDRAFESLTRDLAGRPGAPGGAAAVATVRRRRRTTIASVAAVVVLAVGAVTLPQLTGGATPERRTDVATTGDPLVFTSAAFTEAVEGWSGAWITPTDDDAIDGVVFGEPRCLNDAPGPVDDVEPARAGDVFFVEEGTKSGAFVTFADFGAGADTGQILEFLSPAAIEEACGVAVDTSRVGGVEVRHAHLPTDNGAPATDMWLAVSEPRVSMLLVASPDGGAPAEVQDEVAALLASALDADENFETSMSRVERSTSSGSASSEVAEVPSYPSLDRAMVARETGGWPAQMSSVGELPCTGDVAGPASIWGSSTGDDNGWSTSYAGFESADDAGAAMDRAADGLRRCQSVAWQVRTGVAGEGPAVWATSAQGTFVLAQRWATLAWVSIGEPDAPQPAMRVIASLLHRTLAVQTIEAP